MQATYKRTPLEALNLLLVAIPDSTVPSRGHRTYRKRLMKAASVYCDAFLTPSMIDTPANRAIVTHVLDAMFVSHKKSNSTAPLFHGWRPTGNLLNAIHKTLQTNVTEGKIMPSIAPMLGLIAADRFGSWLDQDLEPTFNALLLALTAKNQWEDATKLVNALEFRDVSRNTCVVISDILTTAAGEMNKANEHVWPMQMLAVAVRSLVDCAFNNHIDTESKRAIENKLSQLRGAIAEAPTRVRSWALQDALVKLAGNGSGPVDPTRPVTQPTATKPFEPNRS